MRPIAAAAFVVMMAVPGCFEGPVDDRETPVPQANPGPIQVVTEGTGCSVLALVAPVTFEEAARWLPPGYRASDLSSFVGLPVGTGSAAYGAANVLCDASNIGPFAFGVPLLFVNPPAADFPVATDLIHGYGLEWVTDHPILLDLFAKAGVKAQNMTLRVDRIQDGARLHDAARSVSVFHAEAGPGGAHWTLDAAGAAPYDFAGGGFMAWTDTGTGTLVYRARLQIPLGFDEITFSAGHGDCVFDPGSVSAQVLGGASCLPAGPIRAAGLNVVRFDFVDSGFTFYPGVHAR